MAMSRLQTLNAALRTDAERRKMLAAPAAITDTSTTQISEVQGTIISPDVIKFAENLRFFQNYAKHDESVLLPNKNKTARLSITNAHLTLTESHTEGDERTYTEMTNIDTVDATPTPKLGGIGITKEIVDTSALDLIDLARYMVAQHHEEAIDDAIATEIDTGSTTNIVWGGDATTAATLATGDTMTLDLVADGIQKLKSYGFKQVALFIASAQEKVFLKSSQFTNAAEYGSSEVRMNGEIGTEKYLGLKIISTENAKTYAGSATDLTDSTAWGAAGHSCSLIGDFMGRQAAFALAWKQRLTVDYEYLKKYATHYIYYDSVYVAKTTQPKALCLIKVTDA